MSFVQLRVADACMVYGAQFFFEYGFYVRDVAEGNGALIEISLGNLSVDNAVYQIADILFSVFR